MRETASERLIRITQMEMPLWQAGLFPGGVDEVGRGPMAGPVVAACVVMPNEPLFENINDSKKVTELRREKLYDEILAVALSHGIACVEVDEIEKVNIRNASRHAMERAVQVASPVMLFSDAEGGLDVPCPQQAIIGGDARSYVIAAASIVAKVYRDRLMAQYHEIYPEYGFIRNKGYGTPEHIAALRKHGPCPIHRPLFIRKALGGSP